MLIVNGVEYAGKWNYGVRQGRGFLTQKGEAAYGDWKDNNLVEI